MLERVLYVEVIFSIQVIMSFIIDRDMLFLHPDILLVVFAIPLEVLSLRVIRSLSNLLVVLI